MIQIAGEELIIELPHREPSFKRASLVARTLFDHSSGGQLIGRFDAAGPGQGYGRRLVGGSTVLPFFCPGDQRSKLRHPLGEFRSSAGMMPPSGAKTMP
jgi:hypothetical protein